MMKDRGRVESILSNIHDELKELEVLCDINSITLWVRNNNMCGFGKQEDQTGNGIDFLITYDENSQKDIFIH